MLFFEFATFGGLDPLKTGSVPLSERGGQGKTSFDILRILVACWGEEDSFGKEIP
jgi:hypothetical protein